VTGDPFHGYTTCTSIFADDLREGGGGSAMWRFLSDDQGQGLVEYALIIAVIAIAVIVAMTFLRDQISNVFSNIGNNLT
jgi:pilus assembly protein Flp/PilA